AHNLKAAGSNPAPATRSYNKNPAKPTDWRGFVLLKPHPYQQNQQLAHAVPNQVSRNPATSCEA
ncbi:hypothetical protein, partial [Tabrizicola sp.]|uniref:hypothetical protein n=1 Tax=Tabrizicola sp. TaxID=2005166 RepID=UPI002FDE42D2